MRYKISFYKNIILGVVVVVVYGFGLVTIQPGLFLELRSVSYFGKSICTSHAGPEVEVCYNHSQPQPCHFLFLRGLCAQNGLKAQTHEQ
jgi:hypothetical protein